MDATEANKSDQTEAAQYTVENHHAKVRIHQWVNTAAIATGAAWILAQSSTSIEGGLTSVAFGIVGIIAVVAAYKRWNEIKKITVTSR